MPITISTQKKSQLPTCVFIGPQKAGTSWIHEYLAARGDICLPCGVKETFFFDERFERKSVDWYASHFHQERPEHRHTIEVAPTYFHSPHAADRIKATLGVVPIIATLRHPVARSFSLYLHMRRYGLTDLPLRDAVEEHPSITDSSRYSKHLRRWNEVFGTDNVHVLFQADMAENAMNFAQQLNKVLKIPSDRIDFDYDKRVNEAAVPRSGKLAGFARKYGDCLRDYRVFWPIDLAKRLGLKQLVFGKPNRVALPELSDADRAWLSNEVMEEIEALEDMLGRDLQEWK